MIGAALLAFAAAGARDANADDEEPGSGPESAAAEMPQPGASGQAGATAAGETGRKGKKGKRGKKKRAPVVSGRVVPEDQLRQTPLDRPSGELHIFSVNNVKDEADVNIYNDDGSYDIDALAQVTHVLRCRRTDTEKPIDPRLITLLSHVYDHFGGRPLEIVSGYRNQRKQTSNHYKATAADIRIKGVAPKKIRAFAETLDTGGMGIGLYPRSLFVHIDVRPLPSYRWIDYSPPNPDAPDKRPPRGWKRKKLQS